MIGRRAWPVLEPGDFGRPPKRARPVNIPVDHWEKHTQWQVKAPDGSMCRLDPAVHTVTEHADGALTVEPSIVTSSWHGWLRNGVWEAV